jgi:hypothetical protein
MLWVRAQSAEGFPEELTRSTPALEAEVVTSLRAATGSADDLDDYVPVRSLHANGR